MKLSNPVYKAIMQKFAKMAFGITGIHFKFIEIPKTENELGYTTSDRKIYITRHHPMMNKLSFVETIMFLKGLFAHEVLHQILTDFNAFESLLNTLDKYERDIFATIFNIMEDPAIEWQSRYQYGENLCKALYFLISTTYKESSPINAKQSPLEQYLTAFIHYGDGGYVKGEFTSEEAEEIFYDTVSVFDKAMSERNGNKRVILAYEVFQKTKPLWEELVEDSKKAEEFMKQLADFMNKMGKSSSPSGGGGATSDCGEEDDGSDDGLPESVKRKVAKRQITVSKRNSKNLSEETEISSTSDSSPKSGSDSSDESAEENSSTSEVTTSEPSDNNSLSDEEEGKEKKDTDNDSDDTDSDLSSSNTNDTEDGDEDDDSDSSSAVSNNGDIDEETTEDSNASNGGNTSEANNDIDGFEDSDSSKGTDDLNNSDESNNEADKDDTDDADDTDKSSKDTSSIDAEEDSSKSNSSSLNNDNHENKNTNNTPSHPNVPKELDGVGDIEEDEFELTDDDIADILEEVNKARESSEVESAKSRAYNSESLDIPEVSLNYKGASCKNFRVKNSTTNGVYTYNAIVASMRRGINVLTGQLKRIFLNDRGERKFANTGRLNIKRLQSGQLTTHVFEQRREPKNKQDICVMFLVDESGSMGGNKTECAKKCAIGLAEVFNNLKIPVAVMGFTADTQGFDVVHYHYMHFRNSLDDRIKLLNIKARANNFDGYSIRYATEMLKKRREEHKLLIIISDGSPACNYYGWSSGISDTTQAIKEAAKVADVIGVAIDQSAVDVLSSMYKQHFVQCTKVEQLFESLGAVIKDKIRGW